MNLSQLAKQLKPYIVPWIERALGNVSSAGGSSGTALTSHALDGAYHTGTLTDAQGPQFLLTDGSRNLTGSLAVSASATIDGVDLDVHASDPAAHHAPVTAGDGIDVTGQAVAVDVTDFIDTSYGLTEATNNIRVNLAADPGLEFATGALRVKVGDGLELLSTGVAVDLAATNPGLEFSGGDLQLGTPGTLTHATTNAKSGATFTHAITAASNPGAAASLLKTTAAGLLQLVQLSSNDTFLSGFAGSGYRIDNGITEVGKTSAEFDNLTVRGRMRVYELLIQQIRATNGSVFVSSASKVERISDDGTAWNVNGSQLTFNSTNAVFDGVFYRMNTRVNDEDDDRDLYHGFLRGDLIRAQRFQMDSNGGFAQVRVSNLYVGTIHSLWEYTAAWVNGDVPVAGDDFVRLGNSQDTTRQGALYLTADDSNAPFMDIVDGITSHADWNTAGKIKVRLGKLTGITDADFGGTLGGYGLYANNVYLKGEIIVTGGNAATITDVADTEAYVAAVEAAAAAGIATKITTGGAAADVNANATTINGGLITTNTIAADRIVGTTLAAIKAVLGEVTLGTGGGIYQGTGTFASPTTGLKVWNDSGVGRIGGYNAGTLQWYANTDGKLYAGAGAVTLDTNGVTISAATVESRLDAEAIEFKTGATDIADIWAYDVSTLSQHRLYLRTLGTDEGRIYLQAMSAGGSSTTALNVIGGDLVSVSGGRFAVGAAVANGIAHFDQASTTGAIPPLLLDQADVSEEFIEFVGTSAANNTNTISTTAVGTYAGKLRVNVNGTYYWLPYYNS